MHRSEAEGRFGEAEPAGRASVCARATPFGVKFGRLDGVRVGSGSKMGKLQQGNLEFTHFLTVKTHLTPMNKG